jgi:hypothetical protein
MISFLMLFVLAASEPVPVVVVIPDAIRTAADTVKPRPAPRPTDQGTRGKPSQPKGPEAQRGKPAPKPTGDPQLKRRKPPELHSPRVP